MQSEAAHKLLNLASGMLGGAVAGALFSRFWRALSDDAGDVPEPAALDRDIREVLVVGAFQGAMAGVIRPESASRPMS